MTDRAIAASNQWKERSGAHIAPGRVIDHPDFPGFVTFADAGTVSAYLVNDANFAGFVTPDDAASAGDANLFIIGGGFATPVGS